MQVLRSLAWLLIGCCSAYPQSLPSSPPPIGPSTAMQPDLALQSSVYVKVQLANKIKVTALKTGDVIVGTLAQDVYSGNRELFPAGCEVHLTVDKLARRRRVPNDHWPWVIKAFTPRYENYPTFKAATVTLPDGRQVPLRVSLIFINRERALQARTKAAENVPGPGAIAMTPPSEGGAASTPVSAHPESNDVVPAISQKKPKGAVVTLEAANPLEELSISAATSRERPLNASSPGTVTLAAGTQAKIILLVGVSASKSRAGDSFQARLVEPVWLNSKVVLPEGTLLGGKVVSRTPPRMLSRSGSILLVFTGVTLPGQGNVPMVASVTAAELDQRSHTKIDAEGKMHGDRPGKAWMALNIGVTAGIAKEADDTIQLIIEAIVSSATDVSTAGGGRIASLCASGLFMLTRHGRDVVLPRFTEINIALDRPLSLAGSAPVTSLP
jgi:hypothetical protein